MTKLLKSELRTKVLNPNWFHIPKISTDKLLYSFFLNIGTEHDKKKRGWTNKICPEQLIHEASVQLPTFSD